MEEPENIPQALASTRTLNGLEIRIRHILISNSELGFVIEVFFQSLHLYLTQKLWRQLDLFVAFIKEITIKKIDRMLLGVFYLQAGK